MDEAVVEAAQKMLDLWSDPESTHTQWMNAVAHLHSLTGAQVLVEGGHYEAKNYAEGMVAKNE